MEGMGGLEGDGALARLLAGRAKRIDGVDGAKGIG